MSVTQNKTVSAQGVQSAQATCTAAKTTYGDATNAVKLLTAGPNGGILYGLTCVAKGTTGAAGRGDVFSSLDGATLSFFNVVAFANYVQSVTVPPVVNNFGYTETAPRRLEPLEQIWVSTSIAATAGVAFDAQYENL